jgi:predicted ABC-type ATPase
MPNLYIIAGCNGAGKTTASHTVLPEMLNCKEFVNADEIARRYKTGVANLVSKYIPICDYWMVVNNSEGPFYLIAEGLKDSEIEIKDVSVWNRIKSQENE